jgi:hypothetical protein
MRKKKRMEDAVGEPSELCMARFSGFLDFAAA